MPANSSKRQRGRKRGQKSDRKIDASSQLEALIENRRDADETNELASKPDEQLFVIDKGPSSKAKRKVSPRQAHRNKLEQARAKPTRTDLLLQNTASIPPMKKNNSNNKNAKKEQRKIASMKKRVASGETKIRKSGVGSMSQMNTPELLKKEVYDLWADEKIPVYEKPQAPKELEDNEWLEPVKEKPIKPPESYKQRPSQLPAVEVVAGQSYRPTYEDHQDLLGEVLAQQMKMVDEDRRWSKKLRTERGSKRRRELAKARKEEAKRAKVEEEQKQKPNQKGAKSSKKKRKASQLASASTNEPLPKAATDRVVDETIEKTEVRQQQLPETNDSNVDQSSTTANNNNNKKSKKKYKRPLTKTQIRKRAILKAIEKRKRLREVMRKKTRKRIDRLPEMVAALERKQAWHQQRLEQKRKVQEEKEKTGTKRLSAAKFEEPVKDALLTDELPASLRLLPRVGNLFRDRFLSLQKRNMIEVRPQLVQVERTHSRRPPSSKLVEKRNSKIEWKGELY